MSSGTQTSAPSGPFDREDTNRTLAIDVEGRRFWVSREYLTMHSPIFKAMLYGDFLEGSKDVIPLPEKKAADFEEFLRCLMPTPEVKKIDYSNVELMLGFADEYQIADLQGRSIDALIALEKELSGSDDRLLEILRIATKYRVKELLPTIIKKCSSGFEMCQLRPMFHTLPLEVMAGLLMYKSEIDSDKKCKYIKAPREHCCLHFFYDNKKCGYCQEKACAMCFNRKSAVICLKRMEVADRDVSAFLDRMYTT